MRKRAAILDDDGSPAGGSMEGNKDLPGLQTRTNILNRTRNVIVDSSQEGTSPAGHVGNVYYLEDSPCASAARSQAQSSAGLAARPLKRLRRAGEAEGPATSHCNSENVANSVPKAHTEGPIGAGRARFVVWPNPLDP